MKSRLIFVKDLVVLLCHFHFAERSRLRLRELDPERLLYESNKQGPGRNGPQILKPLELLDPSPTWYRLREFAGTVTACWRGRLLTEISVATVSGPTWPM